METLGNTGCGGFPASEDFNAYGLDKTGRFLIGERIYGWEMGAYDLVSVDLRTGKEEPILHGVEEFQEI